MPLKKVALPPPDVGYYRVSLFHHQAKRILTMKESKIQTRHPEAGKKNKAISVEKYQTMKTAILKVLQHAEPTHTELMEKLVRNLKGKFQDNISWYGTTVKLDLEARKIIERTTTKPPHYRIR